MTFTQRSSTVLTEVWKGMQQPELNRAVLFFVIFGCVVPHFGDYIYYFDMNVANFTQF
jgi:hypothetical protein